MFWKQNYSTSSPQMEALLNNENVTLTELMDEDEILQECASQNKKLVEFLLRPDVLEELVTLITTEPPSDLPETSRYKYPNMACEILTSDVPSINERLSGDNALLGKLYAFLEQEPPLNPLLCSFFSKTLGMLIGRHTKQVLEFLKGRDNCVKRMLIHIATPAMMDLLFKLITQVEGDETRLNVLNWLDSQQIVQNLIQLMKPDVDSDIHSNVSHLLCDVIKAGREARVTSTDRPESDPIINSLESPETVNLLLDCILNDKRSENSIIGGIQIILALIELPTRPDPSSNAPKDDSSDKELQRKIVGAIIPRLKDFHDILINPPSKPSIRTTAGLLDPPFGNTRLHVSRLIVALVASGNSDIPLALSKEGIINTLLNLFFKYSWNNFLHSQVEQCLSLIISQKLENEISKTTDLQTNLFGECRLIQRILEAWENNDTEQSKTKGVRQGYMGHLIKIANHVETIPEEGCLKELINATLSENPEIQSAWMTFVEGALTQTNETQKILLGGSHPAHCNIGDSNDDYREIPFPATNIHPQLPVTFLENYGSSLNDDEFGDEDGLHNSVDRLNTISFNISDEEMSRQATLFNQVCAQSINTLDINSLDDQDDDIWEENTELSFTNSGLKDVIGNQSQWFMNTGGPSGDAQDKAMEVDNADPWGNTNDSGVTPVVSDNPWGGSARETIAPTEETQQGWADFSSNSFAEFETSFSGSVSTPDPECADEEVVVNKRPDEDWNLAKGWHNAKKRLSINNDENSDSERNTVPIEGNPEDRKVTKSDNNANPTAPVQQEAEDNSDKTMADELTDNHKFLTNQELPHNIQIDVTVTSESKPETIETNEELMVTTETASVETVNEVEKSEIITNGPVVESTELNLSEPVIDNTTTDLVKKISTPASDSLSESTANGPV